MSDTWVAYPEEQRKQLLQSDVFTVHPRKMQLAVLHGGALSVWDLQSGEKIAKSDKPSVDATWEDTQRLVFSPDGDKLLALGEKATVLQTNSLQELCRFDWIGVADSVTASAAFASDGNQILLPEVGDFTKAIRVGVYSAQANQLEIVKADAETTYTSLDFALNIPASPLSFRSSMIEMFNADGGEPDRFAIPKKYRASNSWMSFFASADRSRCVMPVADWQENPFESTVLIGFDTESGALIGPESFEQTPIGVGVSADGGKLFHLESGGLSIRSLPEFGSLGRVDLIRPELRKQLTDETGWGMFAVCTASSSTRPLVATGFAPALAHEDRGLRFASDKELALVDIENQSVVGRRIIPGLNKALFLSDDKSIAVSVAGSTSRIEVLSIPSLETLATLETSASHIQAIAEAPKSHILACACDDGSVAFWDLRRNELLAELTFLPSSNVLEMRFSDNEEVLTATTQKTRYRLNLSAITSRVEAHLSP